MGLCWSRNMEEGGKLLQRAKLQNFKSLSSPLSLNLCHISVGPSVTQMSLLYSRSAPAVMMIQQKPHPPTSHQRLTDIKHRLLSPHKYLFPRLTLIHTQKKTTSAAEYDKCAYLSLVFSYSPHHFTFQFLFASTPRQWNLWFLDRVFLQNRSYRGKTETLALCTCVHWLPGSLNKWSSKTIHLSLIQLCLVYY